MMHGAAVALEHRTRLLDVFRRAADQRGERSIARAFEAVTDRGVDHPHAPLARDLGAFDDHVGMTGGGDDDHRAFLADFGEIGHHLLDLMVVTDHHDEQIAAPTEFLQGLGYFCALLGDFFGCDFADVVDFDFEFSAFQHVPGHRLAHFSATNKSYFHHDHAPSK